MQELLSILIQNSTRLIALNEFQYKRYFFNEIEFEQKLIGLVGARGVGKTTALLQYLDTLDVSFDKKLYISADMIEISEHSLFEIAHFFELYGGKLIVIDEVHKYKDFEKDLKNIYDRLTIKCIFSGSSAIKLEHAKADLSRRAFIYRARGLSFREFLELKFSKRFDSFTLDELLENHLKISASFMKEFKPLEHFKEYLESGYYPFYFDDKKRYKQKLETTINTVIEVDLPSIFSIKYENVINLKKLTKLICSSVPYKINISELSKRIGIHRDRLYLYIEYLTRGSIFTTLTSKAKGDNIFAKPEKLYLNNPNLYYTYCQDAQKGTIRESFFLSMLSLNHDVNYTKIGDFLVDDKQIFEVGGKNKSFKQIKDEPNSFVVADDIESGFGNKIPLWLFGFLY